MSIIAENLTLAEELSRYARLCYDRHLVGAAGGNLSARVAKGGAFLVTASGIPKRDTAPANLVVMDDDGHVLESPAGLKPSKEARLHLAVYKARQDVNAVIHVHPTYATVYAVAGKTIPLATISARLKLKQGTVIPEAPPGSGELSESIAQTVATLPEDTRILLLERHGLIACGRTLSQAFNDAELAEDTAKIAFLLSQSTKVPLLNGGQARIVDLTVPLDEHICTYPTDPTFEMSWHVTYDEVGANVSKLEMGAHTGTHVDAPLHFLGDGSDISSMPLHRFIGEAIAIDTPKKPGENITPADFVGAGIRAGDIVLFRTGWEERSGTPRFFEGDWPGFTPEAIDALSSLQVKAIGGDIPSADSPTNIQNGVPAHKKAMSAGLPIFEALTNMREVVGRRFFFVGLPLKLVGGEASPLRAIAILDWV